MPDLCPQALSSLVTELEILTQNLGFETHPFKIGWYNESVGEKFALPYSDDTLAFVIISRPCMFEKAFLPFIAANLREQIIRQVKSFGYQISCTEQALRSMPKKLCNYKVQRHQAVVAEGSRVSIKL